MAFYKIPQEKIEEIRVSVNLVHYISQYVTLKKTGRNVTGLCPFHHEKTPSFVVNPEKQFYKCYGCGRGGNLYTFIMEYEKLTFPEAVRKAADFAGIILPKPKAVSPEVETRQQKLYTANEKACRFFQKELQKEVNAAWLAYFTRRDIGAETIQKYRLGYAPDKYEALPDLFTGDETAIAEELGLIQKRRDDKGFYGKYRHRVIFPFFNTSGKIIGFGGRKLREEQQPKYLNSPESEVYKKGALLYGLYQGVEAIRDKGFVFLVEGYFDLLRLAEHKVYNVVASSGTALTDMQARILKRYTRQVYIAYDGDAAGRKAAVRNARILENQELNVHILPMPAGEDPDSLVQQKGVGALTELIRLKKLPVEFQLDQFKEANPDVTLEEKDAFISEFLQELATFNNTVKAGLYVHHLSEQLQISESMLVSELNRLRRKQFRQRQMRQEAPPKTETPAPKTEEKPAVLHNLKRGVFRAEQGLIRLLLNGSDELRQHIFYETGADLFLNDDYQNLYQILLEKFEEEGRIDSHALYDELRDQPDLQALVAGMSVDTDLLEQRFADDCIYQLKKWQLEQEARQLSELIRHEKDSEEAQIHYTFELNRVRKSIASLEKSRQKA